MPGDILNLSKNEKTILTLMSETGTTPLGLSKGCKVPRPTIYLTLTSLLKRGLVHKRKLGNKIYWNAVSREEVFEILHASINSLYKKDSTAVEKSYSNSSFVDINIHQGKDPIVKMFLRMVKGHKEGRMMFIQGDNVGDSWAKVIGADEINHVNKLIKKYGLITEIITSEKWFRLQVEIFGEEWAKNFEGRTARFNIMNNKYLDHDSHIFVFKDSVYIISMSDELVVEVRNKKIVKMICQIFNFIQDNTRQIDGNAYLREILDSKQK